MADTRRSFVVFRDDDDNYFAVPSEVIDNHRVRREWKAKLRQALDSDEDVEGFAMLAGVLGQAATEKTSGGSNLHMLGTMAIAPEDLFETPSIP
jgi:hypothetical protein